MKRSLITAILMSSTILCTNFAQAKPVDWTPYLKDMMKNCDNSKIMTLMGQIEFNENGKISSWGKFPSSLKSSIVKTSDYGTFHLKNATAFGQPLTKIYSAEEGDGESTVLTFANGNFMSLMPQFTISDGKRTEKANSKHYWVNEIIRTQQQSDDIYQHNYSDTIISSNPMNYYANNADRELMAAFVNEQHKDTEYYTDIKKQISKPFYQHQQKLLTQILKNNSKYQKQFENENHKAIETGVGNLRYYFVETYRTHNTGYELNSSEYVLALDFHKGKKTITCGSYFRGDVPTP